MSYSGKEMPYVNPLGHINPWQQSNQDTCAISTPLALSSVFMHQSANLLFWTQENVDTWLKQTLTHKDHWSMYIKPLKKKKTDTSNVTRIHRFDCKTKETTKTLYTYHGTTVAEILWIQCNNYSAFYTLWMLHMKWGISFETYSNKITQIIEWLCWNFSVRWSHRAFWNWLTNRG